MVHYGQRPLDMHFVKTLYQMLQDQPWGNRTTPGAVILQKMNTTLSEIRDNDGQPIDEQTRQDWKEAMDHVEALPYGGQHGVRSICMGHELKHNLIIQAFKGRIPAHLYYFGDVDEALQRKFVRFLVSEHQDTQLIATGKDFFDCVSSLRSHCHNVLGIHHFEELYPFLHKLSVDQQEDEKREMAELMVTTVRNSKAVDWKNFTKYLRLALRAQETWDKYVKVNEMYKNFETKDMDKKKESILKGYRDKLLSRRRKKKKKKGKSSKGSSSRSLSAIEKARRLAQTNPLAKMRALRANVSDEKALKQVQPRDIPTLKKTILLEFDGAFDENINHAVLDMIISGELAVDEMAKRKKSMTSFSTVITDMQKCCVGELEQMKEDGEDMIDTMMRLGGFTRNDLENVIINMQSKMFAPLSKTKRKSLANDPGKLRAQVMGTLPPKIIGWIQKVNTLAQRHANKREPGDNAATMEEKLKNEHNQVFKIVWPERDRKFISDGTDTDDLNRYVVLILGDNRDEALMSKAMPDVKLKLIKGSMNYGLNMFEMDREHTTAEDLTKLFRWIKIFNENNSTVPTNAAVMLSCMPQQLGMVEETLKKEFCNAGTAITAWHKPNKFQKNPAVGLVSDLEHMVKGWRSATGKLPADMFRFKEGETKSRLFQAGALINKLQDKNRKVYNKTEENPVVRLAFLCPSKHAF